MKGNPLSQKIVLKTFDRLGAITRRPFLWILVTAVMAAAGGPKGKQAALRGYARYLFGGIADNLSKPLFGRTQPESIT
jgi:hypothetical protein